MNKDLAKLTQVSSFVVKLSLKALHYKLVQVLVYFVLTQSDK